MINCHSCDAAALREVFNGFFAPFDTLKLQMVKSSDVIIILVELPFTITRDMYTESLL